MTKYFSVEGLEKLKKELEERETVIRPEIAHRISEAKELGDLSENAEYSEAREAQGMNEGRIAELQDILKHGEIISANHQHKIVEVGSTVTAKSNDKERQFTIVGPSESNPAQGYISNESPLGSAFLGKKKGDEFEVLVPSGKMKYKIIDIK